MAVFLRIQNPNNALQYMDMNVVVGSFKERPIVWQGVARRTPNGTLLSSQRDPRREWEGTVEFRLPQQLEAFEVLIASGVDPFTQRLFGIRPMLMMGLYAGIGRESGARRSKPAILVLIELGEARAVDEYAVAGTGSETSRLTQIWQLDLVLRET